MFKDDDDANELGMVRLEEEEMVRCSAASMSAWVSSVSVRTMTDCRPVTFREWDGEMRCERIRSDDRRC